MSASKIVMHILRVCIGILILVLILFALLRVGTAAYDLGYRVFTEAPVDEKPGVDKIVEIKQNMSPGEIGTELEEKGLVDSGMLFQIQMRLSAYAKKVKPGIYTLNTSQTAREMLQIMSADPPQNETEDAKE